MEIGALEREREREREILFKCVHLLHMKKNIYYINTIITKKKESNVCVPKKKKEKRREKKKLHVITCRGTPFLTLSAFLTNTPAFPAERAALKAFVISNLMLLL